MPEPESVPRSPDLQRVLALAMFTISLVVGVLALGGRGNALSASFVPLVNVTFGVEFLAAQLLFCGWFRFHEGFVWVAGSVFLSAPLFLLGSAFSQRSGPLAVTGLDRIVGGPALLSGCVLGWYAWKATESE